MGSMHTETTKRSVFIDRWANAEHLSAKLMVLVLGLVGLCIVLSLSMVYTVLRPSPIYYIPGAQQAGQAFPESMPQTTVAVFVSSWVLNWYNFTPATVEAVYGRAQVFMSPMLLAKTKSRLAKDIDDVKRNRVSSSFSMTQEPQVDKAHGGFLVSVRGDNGVYVGKEEIKIQPLIFHVQVRRVSPTVENPYGLMIEHIEQETVT